ncbi:hypothetical protein [Sphingomicrobium arenosum]|uniref:hypothetical protein n=1 Tax=Sphingomicrobium arenosum TaxID=2233861 RepID=UPI002240EA9A|nr:hypothetical protein [Sphingomicrobium arenosum]
MIALIRRLRASAREVRPSDWLLVAIEGVIVFISIFAAFQLTEWATDRREARQVDRLMKRLLVESADALAQVELHTVAAIETAREASDAARLLSRGRCPTSYGDLDAFGFGGWFAAPSTPAYDEMLNGVGLSALPPRMHGPLSSYRANLDWMDENFGRASQPITFFEPDNRHVRVRYLDEVDGSGREDMATAETQGRAATTRRDYDIEGLCADTDFREGYIAAAQLYERYLAIRNDNVIAVANACHALAAQVGEPCYDRSRLAIPKSSRERIDAMLARYYDRTDRPADERWSKVAPR